MKIRVFCTIALALLLIQSFWAAETVFAKEDLTDTIVEDIRTKIALRAADLTIKDMPGIYSWEAFRSCSTFASTYLEHLSFPVNRLGKYASHPDPFPFSGTVIQVEWIKRNYPQLLKTDTLDNFLSQKMRSKIPAGSVVYMQAPLGHNGYNTWYHVVVLVGYKESGQPLFAEISGGRKAAYRSFEEVVAFYNQIGTKPYDIGNKTPKNLVIAWFDPLMALNEGDLWYRGGKVQPGKMFDKFDLVMSVNIYDGTTAIFERKAENDITKWKALQIKGYDEYYAVIGRLLPANKDIDDFFYQNRPDEIFDSDHGIYINKHGVFQHTWTPQLVGEIKTFQYIQGFGGLNGGTDTAIITPLITRLRVPDEANSPFTVHRIPDVEDQDMLLREDLLVRANLADHKPIPQPNLNLSSGCINYDATTWKILKDFLNEQLEKGKKVGIVYSYPDFEQNLILKNSLFESAFTGNVFFKWCPEGSDYLNPMCDSFDRREWRNTYLDEYQEEVINVTKIYLERDVY